MCLCGFVHHLPYFCVHLQSNAMERNNFKKLLLQYAVEYKGGNAVRLFGFNAIEANKPTGELDSAMIVMSERMIYKMLAAPKEDLGRVLHIPTSVLFVIV